MNWPRRKKPNRKNRSRAETPTPNRFPGNAHARRFACLLFGLAGQIILMCQAAAMDVHAVGDQLIVSGPVVAGDFDRIRDDLDSNKQIHTVILRHSPGGHAPTGYQVGALLRQRGIRTAVSGYCFSSCSRMFLGGKIRLFTDDDPPDRTNVGFHGHYDAHGMLDAAYVRKLGLKDWIIQYSDGKADPDLVERWISIPVSHGMAHFFHPRRVQQNGASAFFCDGQDRRPVFACEPLSHSALDLGIITSLEVISSNDRIKDGTADPRPAPPQ